MMMMMIIIIIIIIIIITLVRAQSEYIIGHNKATGHMHWTICKHMWLWLLTITMNINLSHKCQRYHYYVGHTGYHRSNNTDRPT